MEDFRKNNINSSNFVLQLPANYSQMDRELTGKGELLETSPAAPEQNEHLLHLNWSDDTGGQMEGTEK